MADRDPNRRALLRGIGAGIGAAGLVPAVSAKPEQDSGFTAKKISDSRTNAAVASLQRDAEFRKLIRYASQELDYKPEYNKSDVFAVKVNENSRPRYTESAEIQSAVDDEFTTYIIPLVHQHGRRGRGSDAVLVWNTTDLSKEVINGEQYYSKFIFDVKKGDGGYLVHRHFPSGGSIESVEEPLEAESKENKQNVSLLVQGCRSWSIGCHASVDLSVDFDWSCIFSVGANAAGCYACWLGGKLGCLACALAAVGNALSDCIPSGYAGCLPVCEEYDENLYEDPEWEPVEPMDDFECGGTIDSDGTCDEYH